MAAEKSKTARKTTKKSPKAEATASQQSVFSGEIKRVTTSNLLKVFRERAESGKLLRDVLKAHDLPPVVIVECAEELQSKLLVESLRESAFGRGGASRCYSLFGVNFDSTDVVDRFVADLTLPSLFASFELYTVYDVESIKLPHQKRLAEKLAHATYEAVLILCAKEGPGSKNACWFVNEMAGSACAAKLASLDGAKLVEWINFHVKRMGITECAPAVIQEVVDRYGGDLNLCFNELTKLALLTDAEGRVGKKELGYLSLEDTASATVNDLMIAISQRNLARSLSVLEVLLREGMVPLQLTAALSLNYRMLFHEKARMRKGSGLSNASIQASEFSRTWMLNKLRGVLTIYSIKELRESIECLKAMDKNLKSSSFDPFVSVRLGVQHLVERTSH